jgi:hypothetical protein
MNNNCRIFFLYLYLVWNGEIKITLCSIDDEQLTSIYNYFLTTIYPPFELVVFFCFPLLINIFCTILIVRSLSIRIRTAKQFRPSKSKSKDKILEKKSQGILSYFLPKTTSQSNIHSCLCFQIQCRRHTHLRLKISGNRQSLIKYDEENQIIERQRSMASTTCLSKDNLTHSISRTASNILNKKYRTRRTRDIHLSAMLIGLNILYLLLNLPFNFHQTFVKRFHNSNSDICNIMFISLLLDALQQTFFSTNFFLYVLTNRRFREEFYNTIIQILSHCKQNSLTKISNNHNKKHRSRTSSCNPSTALNQPNPMMTIPLNQNRDSIVSDIELTETFTSQQQTILSINGNNKFISKFIK